MTSPLPDQAARERFRAEHERNFSVIAPAGVGKTRAIVDRVTGIALSHRAKEILPRLAVVTYTNKAAEEMQQRARDRLLEEANGNAVMGHFNLAFFGTIHSFCLTLLRSHGYFLGLPTELETLTDEDEEAAWSDFFRQFDLDDVDTGLLSPALATCFRHLAAQDLIGLARTLRPDVADTADDAGACPEPDFDAVLRFTPTPRNKVNVAKGQTLLERWKRDYEGGLGYLPLPAYELGGKDFQLAWHDAFLPLRQWLEAAVFRVARAVARVYRQFRIDRGLLTYADQVRLAATLLQDPQAGPRLRSAGYRIILDEAQDTDPDQFRVLLGLAAADRWGDGPDGSVPLPRPGHFCMVGDPQQSIYSGRADLGFYQQVRERLVRGEAAEELVFRVTFRCDQEIADTANAIGPVMLDGENGQVTYVPLVPRPAAAPGQVVRWTAPEPPVPDGETDRQPRSRRGPSVDVLAQVEAEALADWLRRHGCCGLGARNWSEVAVLCARRRWIDPIEWALRDAGLPLQNRSRRCVRGDDPGFAWFCALAVCLSEPRNAFELTGVLREVFGLSDDELYAFARQNPAGFRIDTPCDTSGPVAETLELLRATRDACLALPLHAAAETLAAQTRLAARLAALEAAGGGSAAGALEAIVSSAAQAEAEESTFGEWAAELRSNASTRVGAQPLRPDAIQLITCHGAKGLEWDTVIVPFLHRSISTRGPEYPYIIDDRRANRAAIVFDPSWLAASQADRIRTGQAQENRRLLYVALTRARRCLVLADDVALFGTRRNSFADGLGLTSDSPPAAWNSLRGEPAPATQGPDTPAREPGEDLAPVTDGTLAAARRAAMAFPRRVLPHALAEDGEDAEPEQEHERDPEWRTERGDAARQYGLWWHALVEAIPWGTPDDWAQVFERMLAAAPDTQRARREWALFLASDTAAFLQRPELIVQVEMPFLRPCGPDTCVEGFIDLAAFDPGADRWTVLDWKTNRIDTDGLAGLARTYAPQLEAYREAVREATGAKSVTALLYATACGQATETG